ncbi:uncharacterized protein BT62DRAFT_992556 [Guyanagaster necrorhizus]|uniref:Uncharacterized protein n=1 Tax=Guyanagaster necrorhizus TaxID=856835 RepID=A0A9P7VWA2_9AGAR|nr:uncharacterized protein BT62DRAFT_992556 [Guyanagaster necrorhizus MCA 3950]KAG7448498.1 hypothetical protein BT62DRAFT_992556 [Guyanagaster necrorhizus MCA 3950]
MGSSVSSGSGMASSSQMRGGSVYIGSRSHAGSGSHANRGTTTTTTTTAQSTSKPSGLLARFSDWVKRFVERILRRFKTSKGAGPLQSQREDAVAKAEIDDRETIE